MEALVVAAHGSQLSATAAEPTYAHCDRIRERGVFEEVRPTFWKEEPSYRNVLRTLESDAITVVPLFISEGYFTETVIPRELRLEGWDPDLWDSDGTDASAVTCVATDVDLPVTYCGPVGTHPAMTDVIVSRAASVTGDQQVGEGVTLAVVGHGTERNPRSAKAIEYHCDRLTAMDRFEDVLAIYMDEPPYVDDLTDHVDTDDVVLVPLFVADGYHTREDIPPDIGLVETPGERWPVPARVEETTIWYAGAVGTEPLVADVILERAVEARGDA